MIIGMLYQGDAREEYGITLTRGVECFARRYDKLPVAILVNPIVNDEDYEGIPLVKDRQMYSKNIILLLMENDK